MDIVLAIGFIALIAMASSAVGAGLMFLAVLRIEGVKQVFGRTPEAQAEQQVIDINRAARDAMWAVVQQRLHNSPPRVVDGEWRVQ